MLLHMDFMLLFHFIRPVGCSRVSLRAIVLRATYSQGRRQREGEGWHAPNRRLSGLFYGKKMALLECRACFIQ